MSLIDSESCICTKKELDLFVTKPTQTAIVGGRTIDIPPTNTLDQSDVIEFSTTTSSTSYMDLRESTLYVKLKITDGNNANLLERPAPGEPLLVASQVYPVNLPLASIFKSCEVTLGGKQIGSTSNLYAYRAMLQTLLSFTHDAKKHQLRAAGFKKDQGGLDAMSTTGVNISNGTSPNKGAVVRFRMSKFSRSFELEGPIFNELWESGKLILSKTRIGVKLTLADPKFCLMSADENGIYKIKLQKALLRLSIKEVASYVRLAHEERLLQANAKYPFTRIEMRSFLKPAGISDLSEANLSTGEIPRRIVLTLVSSAAVNGHLQQNPFNFQHFNVSTIKLNVAGNEIPYGELNLDFGEGQNAIEGYMTLFRGCKLWMTNFSNDITYYDFVNGHSIFVFNLSGDDSGTSAFQLAKEGNVSVHIKLAENVGESVTIVALFEYDAFLEIDKERNVHYSTSGSLKSATV